MHKHLEYRYGAQVDSFYLLWSNVLSLGQLKDVLLSVNDSEGTILRRERNVFTQKQFLICISVLHKADN